ncbi:class I SAM-dependent methyltransferase [Natronoflexus pectinivorans]|uniref:Methyltransferase family protein n=1 Tax=Natronoflexus pectinivorans TaxID=682526 RepID=A0A4R2GGR0_9BACT|nr:class I SAM-dependent methyltransferase [Natronoflexus pectinivorans]TCO07488.1 methyltransferase family protein [Natronoflexus pectinivorans]
MKPLEESILSAMDCRDKEILPHLPYILQDFWDIGTDADTIISIIKKHFKNTSDICILDLGCGKGAVSIEIANELGCRCHGIDGIHEFISFAVSKAIEYSVEEICKFETEDIRIRINSLSEYDVIILGSIGPVFGNYFETLSQLKPHLKNDGAIIIEDGYIEETCDVPHPDCQKKSELLTQSLQAGMQLVEEVFPDNQITLHAEYEKEYNNLAIRCDELVMKFPEKAELFCRYKNQQKEEYHALKTDITCSTMVFKHIT